MGVELYSVVRGEVSSSALNCVGRLFVVRNFSCATLSYVKLTYYGDVLLDFDVFFSHLFLVGLR